MDKTQLRSFTLLMALGTFVVVMDNTIMNVSIQALVADLGTTVSGVQSAIALNALMMAAFVLFGGKLADIIGMKTTFMTGVYVYVFGSLLASFSNNLLVFITGWCLIQGFGAALMLPNVQTIIRAALPRQERIQAYGTLSGVNALGAIAGPIIGGFLTTYFSWRWAFRLEVLSLFVIVLFQRKIPPNQAITKSMGIDKLGTALQACGMVSFVLGILLIFDYGLIIAKHALIIAGHEINPLHLGLSPVVILLGSGVVLFILFIKVERDKAANKKATLLRLSLFNIHGFVNGLRVRAVQVSTIAGILFMIPLFMQVSFNISAFATGLALVPMSISLMAGAILGVRTGKKRSARSIVRVGALIVTAGALILIAGIHTGTSARDLALGLVVFGFGSGLIGSQIVNLILSSVTSDETAEASGTTSTIEQVGNSVGVAILGTVFTVALSFGLSQQLKVNTTLPQPVKVQAQMIVEQGVSVASDQQIKDKVAVLDPNQGEEILRIYDVARTDAFKTCMLLVAGLGLLMFIFAGSLSGRESVELYE